MTHAMSILKTCAALLLLAPALSQAADVSPGAKRWWSHVEVLASDAMEGRETGSEGYQRAAEYVASKLKEAGVQPGAGESYFQEVALVSRRVVQEKSRLTLVRDGKELPIALGEDIVLSARSGRAGHHEAGLVFVGYGLSVPEANHDDLAGLDLKGKVVIFMMGNPPGVPGNLSAHFGSTVERWRMYARAGALGMFGVMNPHKMETPWSRVVAGQKHPTMMLADPAQQELASLPLSGAINPASLDKLLEGSGHTAEELVKLSDEGKPLPCFSLPVALRGELALETAPVSSVNVVGKIPGADPKLAGESVVLSAHLDHVGVGSPVDGDSIYNGAMDNASGIAAMLEVTRTFQQKKLRPRRSVVFVAVTGEEKGLLGSRHFAERPTQGTGRMVANLNMDMFLPITPLTHVIAYGVEESSLAAPLKAVAKRLDVQVMSDPKPEASAFVRSDQYSFIRTGVPALAFKVGYRKGSAQEKAHKEWYQKRYHAPSDDLAQPVDREAAARFVRLLTDLTQRVADAPERPQWNADSFFRRFQRAEEATAAQPVP